MKSISMLEEHRERAASQMADALIAASAALVPEHDDSAAAGAALELACRRGDREAARALIERSETDINMGENPPLHWCVTRGDMELLQMLLARQDVDVNARNVLTLSSSYCRSPRKPGRGNRAVGAPEVRSHAALRGGPDGCRNGSE